MSGNQAELVSRQPRWIYDANRGLYYFYEEQSNRMVYETDGRFSWSPSVAQASTVLSTPRTLPQQRTHNGSQLPTSSGMGTYDYSPRHTFESAGTTSPSSYISRDLLARTTSQDQAPRNTIDQPFSADSLPTVLASLSMRQQDCQASGHIRATVTRRTSQGQRIPHSSQTAGSIRPEHRNEAEREQQLFRSFRRARKPRHFFVVGKVFLVLWSEPLGDTTSATAITSHISETSFGERVYSQIRRFIVVREGSDSCTALKITTYGGNGVANRGDKNEHAIIYTGRESPTQKENEAAARGQPGLLPQALRIDPDHPSEKLDEMSRVHFGKVYTIEHNIKVRSLGKVNRESAMALKYQFRSVWDGTVGFDDAPRQLQRLHEESETAVESTTSPEVVDWNHVYRSLIANGQSEEKARELVGDIFKPEPASTSTSPNDVATSDTRELQDHGTYSQHKESL